MALFIRKKLTDYFKYKRLLTRIAVYLIWTFRFIFLFLLWWFFSSYCKRKCNLMVKMNDPGLPKLTQQNLIYPLPFPKISNWLKKCNTSAYSVRTFWFFEMLYGYYNLILWLVKRNISLALIGRELLSCISCPMNL